MYITTSYKDRRQIASSYRDRALVRLSTMRIPAVDVSQLPTAASFYSAVLQPLGLRYLSTDKDPKAPSTKSVVYGGSKSPAAIFQLRKTGSGHPNISHVILSAPSAEAVAQFHQSALHANPDLVSAPSSQQFLHMPRSSASRSGPEAEARARATDMDGNMMDVVYKPSAGYSEGCNGSSVRTTGCTTEEACRILDWNYNVAASDKQSIVSTSLSTSGAMAYGDEPADVRAAKRRDNGSNNTDRGRGQLATATKESTSSSWNSAAVLGTVLGTAAGVVAGAALTYSVMKDDRKATTAPTPLQQEVIKAQPQVGRRSTFPENHATTTTSRKLTSKTQRLAIEAAPVHTMVSPANRQAAVDDMGYIAAITAPDHYDTRSRVSRYPPSAGSSRTVRTRPRSSSESGGPRKPLLNKYTDSRSMYMPGATPSRATATRDAGPIAMPSQKNLSTAPSRVGKSTSAGTRKEGYDNDGRPIVANVPLDGAMATPPNPSSVAATRTSKHTSATRCEGYEENGRPLVANVPLDGAIAAPPTPISVAPSRVGKYTYASARKEGYDQDGRPVVANLPLNGMIHTRYGSPPSVAPSGHTTTSRKNSSRGLEDPDRPLVANVPLDGMSHPGHGPEREHLPPYRHNTVSRSSFSRSRPIDDFEVVAQDPNYVLDGQESRVSARSRRTARQSNSPPRPDGVGGGGISVSGSRYGAGGGSVAGAVRNVPLPMSRMGDMDDLESVAPSDSISCVGSRYR